MAILGVVESHVLGFELSATDMFIFAAVPIAAAWAFATSKSEKRMFLWILYCANMVVLAGTNYLLIHHKLQQSAPGPRHFVYSEFYCVWMLCVITPFLYFDNYLWVGKRKAIAQGLLLAVIVLLALTAQMSITRGTVLQIAMLLAIVAAGLVKLQKLSISWLLAAIAGITIAFGLFFLAPQFGDSMFGSSKSQQSLADRLSSTDLAAEERTAELHQIEIIYGNDLYVGRGLGSGFASITSTFSKTGENITLAPHIAVFTLLMKGGILAFAIGILLPALWTLKTIIVTNDPEVYASCAAVLFYIAVSCISGGWSFSDLFGYGFFLSHALSVTERTRKSVRPDPALFQSARGVDRAAAGGVDMPILNLSPKGPLLAYSGRRRD